MIIILTQIAKLMGPTWAIDGYIWISNLGLFPINKTADFVVLILSLFEEFHGMQVSLTHIAD